jgi:hypothetical protein
MARGDYEAAWDASARILAALDPTTCDDPVAPYHCRWVWDGTPLQHRHVLVRCYHGLGDTIQFLRYLPALRRIAASVTLEVQPALLPLLKGHPAIDHLVAFDPAAPAAPSDCAIEIMELFFALRLRPDQAPPPYLSAAPAPLPKGTIGLCWQAGAWDPQRSVSPDMFRAFTEWPCISLVTAPTDLAVLNPDGCPQDMVKTASLVAGAALIITVDTMIAHLAGALGRPVWLLLKHEADWRWTAAKGHSPWYPSMRIYRQRSPGDWTEPVAQVLTDLRQQSLRQGTMMMRSLGPPSRSRAFFSRSPRRA